MCTAGLTGLTVIDSVRVAVTLALSVTWMVTLVVAVTFGVPEMTPVLVLRANPDGSLVIAFHVYGAVPPDATSVSE